MLVSLKNLLTNSVTGLTLGVSPFALIRQSTALVVLPLWFCSIACIYKFTNVIVIIIAYPNNRVLNPNQHFVDIPQYVTKLLYWLLSLLCEFVCSFGNPISLLEEIVCLLCG